MDNPAANATTPSNPTSLWVPEPKQRGTFGIISICLSTLIICIWSTLHFNIPTMRCTVTRRFFTQVLWMFIALLAPEYLLYLAIIERVNAGILLRKVLKFHPHLATPGMLVGVYNWIRGRVKSKDKRYDLIEQTSQPHFSLVHAFYATMGGFAFYGPFDDDKSTAEESFFQISTNPRHTIEVPNFETLIYIMKHFHHILTDIPEEYILNQAASSSLSKALLIVQVAWFCTNCTSRLFQGLPLSLLEVSTAAHALYTLLTYFVWWSKPIDVPAPTIMREKEAREVYALLKCSDDEYDKALKMAQKRATGDSSTLPGTYGSGKILLAADALQNLLPTPERPPRSLRFYDGGRMMTPGTLSNEIHYGGLAGFLFMGVILIISPILYGLVHFLAWDDLFPTPLERLLWRVCSLVVTCSGLAEFCVSYIMGLIMGFSGDIDTIFGMLMLSMALLSTTVLTSVIIPFAHILASGFLVVESFRQLSFLDSAAYQLPSWSNYWPHFS